MPSSFNRSSSSCSAIVFFLFFDCEKASAGDVVCAVSWREFVFKVAVCGEAVLRRSENWSAFGLLDAAVTRLALGVNHLNGDFMIIFRSI